MIDLPDSGGDAEADLKEFQSGMEFLLSARPSREQRKAAERASTRTKKERSRSSGQTRSSAVHIRVTPSFKALLDRGADQLDLSATTVIEEAVTAYLKSKGITGE